MPTLLRIVHNTYRDSVSLMQLSARIAGLAGVRQASVVMATEGNLALLREAGLLEGEVQASPSDLLVLAQGDGEEAARAALDEAERGLAGGAAGGPRRAPQESAPRSIRMALQARPDANLALISTPGEYAAAEALKALRLGLNVMVFSDNVSVADEVLLKREAEARGLLVMGPDCGTSIIAGVPLGFANAVRRGPIGVVGASGTGLQQVTSLIDQAGLGVSHALGTGGRDLKADVGGATMLRAIDELAADPGTRVIVLVSKPPAAAVAERVLARANASGKPVIACFLGAAAADVERGGVRAAATLEQAAAMAVAAARGERYSAGITRLPQFTAPRLAPGQRYLRGLYSGGTFCYEATLLLSQTLEDVHSNTPVGGATALADVWHSRGHTLIDLGDDEFTRGRPHPMIDHRLRNERLVREAADAQVAVILLDVVLGYGAHPDPAAEMLPALRAARATAQRGEREIAFVGFVCGTERDPQGYERQSAALAQAGVILAGSNAQAARIAASIALHHAEPARS
ncbi:MAG TPA: acyl-CoA synthetase FdrA [Burkholderiales bacterium]|nr:acyl-CoA synthetase FdrA [Burkholderiales bacterium]